MIQLMETHYTIKCTEGELRALAKAVRDFDINSSNMNENEKSVLLDFRKRYNFLSEEKKAQVAASLGGLLAR